MIVARHPAAATRPRDCLESVQNLIRPYKGTVWSDCTWNTTPNRRTRTAILAR